MSEHLAPMGHMTAALWLLRQALAHEMMGIVSARTRDSIQGAADALERHGATLAAGDEYEALDLARTLVLASRDLVAQAGHVLDQHDLDGGVVCCLDFCDALDCIEDMGAALEADDG